MTYPRFQRARHFKFAERTSGDLTLNSTSWADVDTGLDLDLLAEAGDVIKAGVSALMGSEAVEARLDVATIVSAAVVNTFGGTAGVPGWVGPSGALTPIGGSVMYELVSGDIDTGVVTLRLRYQTSTATNKTLEAGTDYPLMWWVRNLGPAAEYPV